MKCEKCKNNLVVSNLEIDECELEYPTNYTRYFCFNCNTLYECISDSGDMLEENLHLLGEI